MEVRNLAVYLPLVGAIACGPNVPKNETIEPGPRQVPYTEVTRNNITERNYPTHVCLIDATSDLHLFYCDKKSNSRGLDSVSRVHLIRPASQDTSHYDGQDKWIDGTTAYATDAFPDGFDVPGIVAVMQEPLERKSPEFAALERNYASVQGRFRETNAQK